METNTQSHSHGSVRLLLLVFPKVKANPKKDRTGGHGGPLLGLKGKQK